jgi:arsenate reductase (glutaredoxin)
MSLTPRPDAFVLLHNPKCSKSRQLKAELDARGTDYDERRYLDEPLSRRGLDAHAMIRRKEAEYAAAGLSPKSTQKAVLDAVATHPKLLERPVLIAKTKAAIGRPTEAALELLD